MSTEKTEALKDRLNEIGRQINEIDEDIAETRDDPTISSHLRREGIAAYREMRKELVGGRDYIEETLRRYGEERQRQENRPHRRAWRAVSAGTVTLLSVFRPARGSSKGRKNDPGEKITPQEPVI